MMSLLPRKKSPAYLVIGAVLLFMGIINFSGDKGTVTPQAIMFNTLYLVVGAIMVVGSRMIFFKPPEEKRKKGKSA